MEIFIGCIGALMLIALVSAFSCAVIFLTANYIVCPAFGLTPITWLQALAVSIVLGILSGYFKRSSESK